MATRRRTRSSTALPASSDSILTILDEGALGQVLLAAKDAKVLGFLASSSRQLCSFARSRVPMRLSVYSQERAALVIQSHACGRPPFSGCTELSVMAGDAVMCCLALGVLNAAQQWTGLQKLELNMCNVAEEIHAKEFCAASMLSGVPALRQLRSLEVYAPALGVSAVVQLQQLTQLTCLHLTASHAPAAAAADLTALGRLTNLVKLHLNWALAPHLPAGPGGPYCLPSSLVALHVYSLGHSSPAPMACWVAHLPGCKQLQHLHLLYGPEQDASVHPSFLVPRLVQCNPQLRTLQVSRGFETITWDADVAGLPATAAAAPVPAHWQPDASLAALAGLESLSGGYLLAIRDQADWQHLAQASALTSLGSVRIMCVPELQPGTTLRLLQLSGAQVALGGYGVGRLLLACPLLQSAVIFVTASAVSAGGPLVPHPSLQKFCLRGTNKWGNPAAAAEQFAALAPVLSRVSGLDIQGWPLGSSSEVLVMPDLSPCTAVTALVFAGRVGEHRQVLPMEQEAILLMVAPLKQLQQLEVTNAPRVNARIALGLQSLLPQLQDIDLVECGRLLPAEPSSGYDSDDSDEEESEQETRARQQVLQLLRSDLKVMVYGYAE